MASGLGSLALLKSPHPKGHPLLGTAAAEIALLLSKAGSSSGRMALRIEILTVFQKVR